MHCAVMKMHVVLCLALTATYLVPSTMAHPAYYLDFHATGCQDMGPQTGFAMHRSPQADPTTVISVLSQGKLLNPTSSVCPGQALSISASWPGIPRESLIVASSGKLSQIQDPTQLTIDSSCPNRMRTITGNVVSQTSPTSLTLPCSVPGGKLSLWVTSATSAFDFYHTATVSFTVNTSCGVGSCVPKPSPPPPNGTAPKPPPARPKKSPPPPLKLKPSPPRFLEGGRKKKV